MKSSDKSRSTFVAQQMLSDKSRMFVMAISVKLSNNWIFILCYEDAGKVAQCA